MLKLLPVVLGRFQNCKLHNGHKHLIDSAYSISSQVLVLIGSANQPIGPKNPVPAKLRRAMLAASYPQLNIALLDDMPGQNKQWSDQLDKIVQDVVDLLYKNTRIKFTPILLYSRDSFIKHYEGSISSLGINEVPNVSATQEREAIQPRASEEFLAGMIYAALNFGK